MTRALTAVPDERLAQRFWSKVDTSAGPDACWPWLDHLDPGGYGRLSVGGRAGRMEGAHRVSILLTTGALPEQGMHTDHLCRNKRCVNPAHLEVVTPSVNGLRGAAGEVNAARQRAITHCPAGHPYDEANTRVRDNGGRTCRACAREYQRRSYVADPEKFRAATRRYRSKKRQS